ncbi:phosphotransferase [uncultured Arcticibacterium sp.]|uniref:phosphotransferase n=1 Tax=uncultured Arcticibacterium sp. TaxID=2173042 RepID=UPI0030F9928C
MILTEELNKETEAYFREKGWLKAENELLEYVKAGEGNMNFVARVKTNGFSFIVKQSRAYVEKYKQVPAPIERIEVEHAFYMATAESEFINGFSPEILDFDEENHVLVMEDLGEGTDFLGLYAGKIPVTKEEIVVLIKYLMALHSLKPSDFPENADMKSLNHEHIFNYPYLEENGFDLNSVQEGLQELAMPIKQNEVLKAKIKEIGNKYLVNGKTLLHGDFYPGSWLKVEKGLKVIDPEFAFMGDPEFDLGVMLAHFKMAGLSEELIDFTQGQYKKGRSIDEKLLSEYMAVEVLRRLIGLAQLPLNLSIKQKKILINEAVDILQ